jgi:tRNA(Arg) A34 adenosine deaminase TadA
MHESFLRRAIHLAVQNVEQGRGGPFGAVIVLDGRVIAEGANSVTRCLDPTAHAEIVAIRDACTRLQRYDLRGAVLYASCEPCPMCLAAIYWARLDALFYAASRHDAAAAGFDDSFLYAQIPLDDSSRALPTRRLLVTEAGAPFHAWRDSESKIPY